MPGGCCRYAVVSSRGRTLSQRFLCSDVDRVGLQILKASLLSVELIRLVRYVQVLWPA